MAYLWQRDQDELIEEMVGCKIEAILIKVAALGLEPAMHLGKTIAELKDHLRRMSGRFGNNVCGEGDSLGCVMSTYGLKSVNFQFCHFVHAHLFNDRRGIRIFDARLSPLQETHRHRPKGSCYAF